MSDFTLYWSSLDRYEHCPQLFLWSRGWGDIDLGAGPGKAKPEPYKKSKHHAVMGIVIQAAIERMYKDELWKHPVGLKPRLLEILRSEWERQTLKPRNYIDYRIAGTKASLMEICEQGVLGYLRTMKHNRLAGEWTQAEFELLGWVDPHNPVGGRCDLIFRRADTGITILDGKNSQSKGKYTDPDQLRWYAMLYYLGYKQMPDRLGFVYYRYPHGTPILDKDGKPTGEIETGVDWVTFTKDDIQGLARRAVEARKGLFKGNFEPNPVPSYCRFCDYEDVCTARQEQKASRRRKAPHSIEGVAGANGFVDLKL